MSGGRVIYAAGGPGKDASNWELWSVPATGGESRKEPTPCAQTGSGTFRLLQGVSYSRQRLFLTCQSADYEAALWLTGIDGSSPRSIGHYNSGLSPRVSISPDLKTLLFSRTEGLFAKPVDGGAERQLVRPNASSTWSYTFWHPAGDRIGFLRKMDGLLKAWEVRADGTGLRPLVPEFAGQQYGANWSPDGRRLYFVSKGDIYLQRSRGWLGWMRRPEPMRLTSSPAAFDLPQEDPANPLVVYALGNGRQAGP